MGSEFSVRAGTAADLQCVADIKVRNWEDTYGTLLEPAVLHPFLDTGVQLTEMRERFAQPGTLLLVAEDGAGKVAGFALTFLDDEPEPWLESLHVLHEFRGSGIGTMLMRRTAQRLIAREYNSLRLGVISGNAAAARFYERLGGEMIGLEPVSWAPGASHEIYRWEDITSLAQMQLYD